MMLMGGDGDVNAGTEVLVAMSVIKNAWEMIWYKVTSTDHIK